MGSGAWDTDTYSRTTANNVSSTGSAFAYNATMSSLPKSQQTIHPTLDPQGMVVRESRDSDEHPNSVPIMVWLDVTGTNIQAAKLLQEKLPQLNGLLLRKGYVEDPQICFAAIGDATCDYFPVQVGQFESDNRMDENLANIILENGGGGQAHESYELALYTAARLTSTDAFEKRGQKGYLFILGDEKAYPFVTRENVKRIFGQDIEADIPLKQIVEEATEKFNVFYVMPNMSAYGTGSSQHAGHLNFWRGLLGENVLELEDVSGVSELIGVTIGMLEGSVDLDGAVADLQDIGTADRTLTAVSSALAGHSANSLVLAGTGGGISGLTDQDGPARRI